MAVVNQFKFFGVDDVTSTSDQIMFGTTTVAGVSKQNPLVNETYIIKSLKVTSAGTPTVTVTNNAITTIKTAALSANVTQELLTQPLIVEGDTILKVASSTTDSFDIAISYMNIQKERID
jgi:Ca2+-binding RTX toxin-like protein